LRIEPPLGCLWRGLVGTNQRLDSLNNIDPVAEEGVVFEMHLLVVLVEFLVVLVRERGPRGVLAFAIPLDELFSQSSVASLSSAVQLDKNKLGIEQDGRIDFADVTQLLEQT
jgi:hypothetical protein